MKKIKQIISSTSIDLDGHSFSLECLEDFKKQIDSKSIEIQDNHDASRVKIWYIEKWSAEILKLQNWEFWLEVTIVVENEETYDKYLKISWAWVSIWYRVWEKKQKLIKSFPFLIKDEFDWKNSKIYVVDSQDDFFKKIQFFPEITKDNLYKVDNFKNIKQWWIEFSEYILAYSKFLRRSFYKNNTYNHRLINEIIKTKIESEKIDLSILIEWNEFFLKEDYRDVIEKDFRYWIEKINLENIKFEVSRFEKDWNIIDISTSENKKENLLELEIEEIDPRVEWLDYGVEMLYPLRYFHLQYDISLQKVIHFDWAVRLYNKVWIDYRIDNKYDLDLTKIPKDYSKRVKTFRIDWLVAPENAFNIAVSYFWGNQDIKTFFSKYTSI